MGFIVSPQQFLSVYLSSSRSALEHTLYASEWDFHDHSFLRKYPPAPLWGSLWAIVWIPALA